jgi:hypothetical protein
VDWDLGMADAVLELTFDRPAFTVRSVSRVERFYTRPNLRLCSRAMRKMEEIHGVSRDMPPTAGFASKKC